MRKRCLKEHRPILFSKAEIRLLFSPNAESSLKRFALEIVDEKLVRRRALLQERMQGDSDDHFLYAVATASASFGLIETWLTMDIDKTPAEMVRILKRVTGDNLLM